MKPWLKTQSCKKTFSATCTPVLKMTKQSSGFILGFKVDVFYVAASIVSKSHDVEKSEKNCMQLGKSDAYGFNEDALGTERQEHCI